VFKELMFDRLAERTGLSRDKLSELLYQHHQAEPEWPEPEPDRATPVSAAPPKRRAPQAPSRETTRNPILYAIAIVLHAPAAARQVEAPEALQHSDDPNAPLLLAMLELLHKRPDSSSAMLIGHWYGETWGETLQELLQMDQFIPEADLDVELSDTLSHIQQQHQRAKLANDVDKILSKDYAQTSEDEKRLLRQSLQDLHNK